MSPIKIGAIVLIIIAGLAGSYFTIKNSAPLFPENQIGGDKISGAIKEIKKEIAKNPIKWIEQSLGLEKLSNDSKNENLFNETPTLTEEKSFNSGSGFNSYNFQSGGATDENYLAGIANILSKSGFSETEFKKMGKDKNGRPLSFEELLEKAASGGNSEELKNSFFAWKSLAERTLKDFKAGDVSSETANKITPWLDYYVKTADKLSSENLSSAEIKILSDQYREKAKNEAPKFQGLAPMENTFSFIKSFIKPAMAQGVGFYDFGGLVGSYTDTCLTGVAVAIIGTHGGNLWIYYGTWIINPYLYSMMVPSYYVLGRAMWGPGWCTYAGVDGGHPAGTAMILYFGSSLTPI